MYEFVLLFHRHAFILRSLKQFENPPNVYDSFFGLLAHKTWPNGKQKKCPCVLFWLLVKFMPTILWCWFKTNVCQSTAEVMDASFQMYVSNQSLHTNFVADSILYVATIFRTLMCIQYLVGNVHQKHLLFNWNSHQKIEYAWRNLKHYCLLAKFEYCHVNR